MLLEQVGDLVNVVQKRLVQKVTAQHRHNEVRFSNYRSVTVKVLYSSNFIFAELFSPFFSPWNIH